MSDLELEPAAGRYWVLGGRWVENARHLPWPRVFGPYGDYQVARAIAQGLNSEQAKAERYLVVADVGAEPTP